MSFIQITISIQKRSARVLDLDKDRTPAYLNLGDALQGQKKDPTSAYGEYCKRAPRSKWPKRLAQASAACQ
ncbi:hypothetical protein E3A20_03250 [Planctomyces bekefii]|uniref:Uncharacterized protein n=1 Tax=Planctomyces bekefii TaxID=1653850 RepID=A0A5C6MD52_9PLAN|nr:hypothetical protein E3A20_03250 [Planctomyces bekefii]